MGEQELQVEMAGCIEDLDCCFEAVAFVRICSPLISPGEIKRKFSRPDRLSHWFF
jgi:hypothetical protein